MVAIIENVNYTFVGQMFETPAKDDHIVVKETEYMVVAIVRNLDNSTITAIVRRITRNDVYYLGKL